MSVSVALAQQSALPTDGTEDLAAGVELSEAVFGQQFNEPLVHQAVVAYLAGGRQGHESAKDSRRCTWRRTQAVAAEEHWPSPRWHHSQPALAWRR